jgi:hypothetical protein
LRPSGCTAGKCHLTPSTGVGRFSDEDIRFVVGRRSDRYKL